MKISRLTGDQWINVAKVALYVGFSAFISQLITEIAKQPDMFGVYTVLVNSLLVFIKGLLTDGKA